MRLVLPAMLFTAALCISGGSMLLADPVVAGHVIVARPDGDALLIWDASADVASIVHDKTPDSEANARLERDALYQLSASLGKIARNAKSLTVRVVYNRTGDISPVYGSATFAGVERYATLTAAVRDLVDDRDHWKATIDKAVPSWIVFKVTGQLPPR